LDGTAGVITMWFALPHLCMQLIMLSKPPKIFICTLKQAIGLSPNRIQPAYPGSEISVKNK